ncbi:MAG: RidA family protein [Chloroflexales bacterium]|nr:RidA family protein [Chloroflexales bacterium]
MNEIETAAGLPQTANYRYAKRLGNQLFVAGQVPHDSSAQLVGKGDPSAQATQCLTNLRKLIEVNSFNEDDIQQLTVYVVGEHSNLVAAWAVVETWFERQAPPATLLGVSQLGYIDQLVEIDATIIREA